MDEDLLGYLLDALDADTHRQVETYLRDRPEGRQQLHSLRHALEPLAADRDEIQPPNGLAIRTLARVAEYKCRELPITLPLPAPHSAPPPRSRWRRADVGVLAAAMLLGIVLVPPVIARVRFEYAKMACQKNLQRFHQALASYSDQHRGNFPKVGDEEDTRRNVPGIIVPILHDAGCLGPDVSMDCPATGQHAPVLRSLAELDAMLPQEFAEYAPRLAGCYSYALGYRDSFGRLHGYRAEDNGLLPIMADRPLLPGENGAGRLRGNSPNHNSGQNILFIDGAVQFRKDPYAGVANDNIYLNQDGEPRAGLNASDSSLGTGSDTP